jgi:hypothetical protein
LDQTASTLNGSRRFYWDPIHRERTRSTSETSRSITGPQYESLWRRKPTVLRRLPENCQAVNTPTARM